MRYVTKDDLREIWRRYLVGLIEKHCGRERGAQAEFARRVGLKHAQVSNAVAVDSSTGVSYEMLARVDRSGIERLGVMYAQVAGECDAFQRRELRGQNHGQSPRMREPWEDVPGEGVSEDEPPAPRRPKPTRPGAGRARRRR